MKASELKALLEPYGISPLRARGQHFLLDEGVVAKMIAASGVGKGSRVLEIGPGPGILTSALLDAGADVVAVELDIKLQALCADRFGDALTLVRGDVMHHENSGLVARFSGPGSYRVVANIPYVITSPVLEKFLQGEARPESMTIMIQKEVADRILAKPGDMSSIAVLVQTLGSVHRVTNVAKGAFFPPPKVDSSVIHIVLKTEQERASHFGSVPQNFFFSVVRTAFGQKRKQLRNSLKGLFHDAEDLEKSFNKAKIRTSARPEELSVAQWSALVESMRLN
ncbi:16S rRNA (adenine(1518)-N(6)/adenine(1519)-N(6))-dimethyltransferase RsmA [Patescibacteria group bacterium]